MSIAVSSTHALCGMPGGASDLIARAVIEDLSKFLGQPVLEENIPSIARSLAVATVIKSHRAGDDAQARMYNRQRRHGGRPEG